MCVHVLCFFTCFPLGSFVCGHGTFKAILLLHYKWLTLHQSIQSLPFTRTPNELLTLIFSLINSPALSCFCSILFLFVSSVFSSSGVKNSLWKQHMKKWWLRSYSRSGHVWISNSYPAGLSWTICPERSILQWVSQLITGMPSWSVPVLSTSWQAEDAEETFLGGAHHFWGL